MDREKVAKSLGVIGLSKMEAEVYLYVASNPETTAGDVTKNMRIARSKTYEALNKLSSMGLVSKMSKNEVSRYYSSGSSVLKGMYMQQMEEATKAMDYIQNMNIYIPTETRVRTVEGEEGYRMLKESFLADLKKGDEILIIGSPANVTQSLVDYFQVFHTKRIAMGVKLKMMYNSDVGKDRFTRARGWKNTEVRALPKNNSPAWVEIYGNRVIIPLVSDKIIAIAITDKSMATSFKNYFDLLWKSTKEFPGKKKKR
ncbi:MAG: hypothetical protein GY852_10305 [bacterium]|nr:hypothetical protein [bacterium]